MRTATAILGLLLVVAGPAAAQMVTGYSVNSETGLVTTFSCLENGDPQCFRNRIELGTIDPTFFTGSSAAVALAPSGELVVGNPAAWGEVTLDWIDLPSLEVVRSLPVIADIQVVYDIAFAPDSTLWMTALPDVGHSYSLYTVDQTTGVATGVWNLAESSESLAFVGERLFLMGGTKLIECDIATGVTREIVDYFYPGPYPWPALYATSLTSFDDRLWSLSFSPPYPPGPYTTLMLGTHDMETGYHDVVAMEFDLVWGNGDPWWTLDLVDTPEQQPAAIPAVGRLGLAAVVVLIGLAGVLLARRLF